MKTRVVVILTVAAIAASAIVSFAGMEARSGVSGSIHDMNIYAATRGDRPDNYDRVCAFCHTPHNTVRDPDDPAGVNHYPLWNHQFTPLTYTPYRWSTPDKDALIIVDPLVGPSRLCMSCHDGLTATDQHGLSMASDGSTLTLSGRRAIGRNGDLSDDHPIGFSYIDAFAGNLPADAAIGRPAMIRIVDPANYFATDIAISIDNSYNTIIRAESKTIQETLYNGSIMTCATCHEVHNRENALQPPGTDGSIPNHFLRAKERYSLICLSCHQK